MPAVTSPRHGRTRADRGVKSVMRRLLIWERLCFSFKTLVDSANDSFEKLNAALKIEHRSSLIDQSIVEISDGLLLEGYLGLELDVNTFSVFMGHLFHPRIIELTASALLRKSPIASAERLGWLPHSSEPFRKYKVGFDARIIHVFERHGHSSKFYSLLLVIKQP